MNTRLTLRLSVILIFSSFTMAYSGACHYIKPIKPYLGKKVSKFGVYKGYLTARYNSWVRQSRYVNLPGGSRVALDIIIPAKNCIKAHKPLPILLMQTPYQRVYQELNGKISFQVPGHRLEQFIRHGYIFSVFAIKGTAASMGVYRGLLAEVERKNAYSMIEWLAKQPFSNGKIGMIGSSYNAVEQFMAVSQHPPHLKAIFPVMSPFNIYDFVYPGGIFRQGLITHLSQLLSNINLLSQLVPVDADPLGVSLMKARTQHKSNVDILKQLSQAEYASDQLPQFSYLKNNPAFYLKQINKALIPVYISEGWYDIFIADGLFWYANYMGPKKMIIGVWPHSNAGSPAAQVARRQKINTVEMLRWFDYWLKGIKNGVMSESAIHYDILKQDYRSNTFNAVDQWPPNNIKYQSLYFSSAHRLTSKTTVASTVLPPDLYTINYTTTTGAESRWNNAVGQGRVQYADLAYNDMKSLLYTTAPLKNTMTVIGFPLVTLFVACSESDVDIHVVLEEVDNNGFSHYLSEGMLRASERKLARPPWKNYSLPYQSHKRSDKQLLKQQQIVKLQFYLSPLSRLIPAGDRIRVAIMGADMGNSDTIVFSRAPIISLYHDHKQPSLLALPVLHNRGKPQSTM